MKKYEFTGETKIHGEKTLHQIRRISDGLIGGYIETEANLSHKGNCFVSDNACVYGNAVISEQTTQIIRSDGYTFIYVTCSDGVKRIIAGCRYFTKEEAIEHWNKDHPRYKETIIILNALFQIGEL